MDTNDYKTFIFVFLIPSIEIWGGSLAIDTAVRPKIKKDNFLANKTTKRNRLVFCVYKPIGSSNFFCQCIPF